MENGKELITKQLCMTKNIGINGNLFGGDMLSFIDIAGAIYASEKCETPNIVTLSLEKLTFLTPVKVGNIIYIYGEVLKMGNTSITIKITVYKHNVITKKEKLVCETQMVFVKVDSDGEPCPINIVNVKTNG